MKRDGLKDVLTAFGIYKEYGCQHVVRCTTPGCSKKEVDTEEVLTLYDLDAGDYRECIIKNIFKCNGDETKWHDYIFHIIYTDDNSEKYYAISDDLDESFDFIEVLDESESKYVLSCGEPCDYMFLTRRDRDHYLNITWPQFIDTGDHTLSYENLIDKDHALYRLEWMDGNDNLHVHHIVLTNHDKCELLKNPYWFAESIESTIHSCHKLIDYEEEK